MRRYELLIILNADISDEVLNGMIERITQAVKKEGGEINSIDKWGKRRLAYDVKRSKKGFYLLMQLFCDPQIVKEIEKNLKFIDGIERYIIIGLSDKIDLSLLRSYSAENREEAVI